jgi:hypothetical protein
LRPTARSTAVPGDPDAHEIVVDPAAADEGIEVVASSVVFAEELARGAARLEERWREHRLLVPRPGGAVVLDADVPGYTHRARVAAAQIVADARDVVEGDRTRDAVLAHEIVAVYAASLEWASTMRSTRVSDRFVPVIARAATALDDAIDAIRAFVVGCGCAGAGAPGDR